MTGSTGVGSWGKPTAVDIFAGLGGMSLGAVQAGLDVRVAIEIDEDAAQTYRENHPTVHVLAQDVRQVSGAKILAAAGTDRIDVLMGCAPCQGFTSLTAKYRRDDDRNQLVLEIARLAEELQPRCVVMENVPRLATKGKALMDILVTRLSDEGYQITWDHLQMADYGVPQRRRRLVLVAMKDQPPELPHSTHANPIIADAAGLQRWRTVRDVVPGLGAPIKLRESFKSGGPRKHNWHVVSNLTEATKRRLQAAVPGESRLSLDPKLLPDCHQGGYSGFSNVYTRMRWDEPSPTITAGCLTPSKGRFGHPDRRRWTLSVREAARLQTIPDDFSICTDHMESACQMIGNAVPPLFSKLLFEKVVASLSAEGAQ